VKEKTIKRLVRGGFNIETATEIVEKYFELAIRCGCETPKEFADTVSGLYAVD